MKFIEKIIIENFQSHRYTEIDFSPELNIITGSSDSGKTSIIRAIRWALFNEPSGTFFIREGSNESSVTIKFNNNLIIKRYRNITKNQNQYIIIYPNGDELKLEGFGVGVPTEVLEATGIKKISLDSSTSSLINISTQLEGPFLLSEKSSTKANAIGRIVGVEIIDEALKIALRDLHRYSIKENEYRGKIEDLSDKIKGLNYLKKMEKDLCFAKERYIFLNDKIEYYKKLSEINKNKRRIHKELEEVKNNRLNKLEFIPDLEQKIYILEFKGKKLTTYKKLFNRIENVKFNIEYQNNMLTKLTKVENAGSLTKSLEGEINYFKNLFNFKNRLKFNLFEKKEIEKTLEKFTELTKVESELIKMGEQNEKMLRLEILKTEYKNIKNRLVNGRIFLEKLNLVEKTEEELEIISYNLKLYNSIKNIYENLKTIKKEKLSLSKDIKEKKDLITNLLKSYGDLMEELGTCPYCFQKIDKKELDFLINKLS